MDEQAVINVVSMVKTTLLARIRADIKAGDSIIKILDRYEYATYAFQEDGSLVMVTAKREKQDSEKK
jgi:hypothetical protein